MSRRLLALSVVLLVPIAGPLLAWMVRGVRGGMIALEPPAPRRRARPTADDVRRLGSMPSVVERLLSRDAAERLSAMVHLSSVGDHDARRVLQWTIEHGPTEVVLEAALTLEEIELRAPAPPVAAPPRASGLRPQASPDKVAAWTAGMASAA